MSRSSSLLPKRRQASDLPPSPAAVRPRRGWWRDVRVIAGVLIVVACVGMGVRLASPGDATVEVWRATRDLPAGFVPGAEDLQPTPVSASAAGPYAIASAPITLPLQRPVFAGELLPVPAESLASDARWVTVPVEPMHAPPDLAAGESVEVWATATADLGATSPPRRILDSALVSSVAADAVDFGGDYGVIVQVAPGSVSALLGAIRSGSVDLVRIPMQMSGEAS